MRRLPLELAIAIAIVMLIILLAGCARPRRLATITELAKMIGNVKGERE